MFASNFIAEEGKEAGSKERKSLVRSRTRARRSLVGIARPNSWIIVRFDTIASLCVRLISYRLLHKIELRTQKCVVGVPDKPFAVKVKSPKSANSLDLTRAAPGSTRINPLVPDLNGDSFLGCSTKPSEILRCKTINKTKSHA